MKRRRIDWLGWLLAAFVVYGCPKTVTTKADLSVETDTSSDQHTENDKSTSKDVGTTVDKHEGPSEIEQHVSDELFGWAPPPPGVLDKTPQWLPLKRHNVETITKTGPVDTKKTTETKAATQEAAKTDTKGNTDEKIKDKGTTVTVTPSFIETLLGPHWRMIVFGVVAVLVLGAATYANPNLLGVPAKILKWGLGKLLKRKIDDP